ncbi:hypothetical protein DOY81_008669, partial [Sarcophaga bullata]
HDKRKEEFFFFKKVFFKMLLKFLHNFLILLFVTKTIMAATKNCLLNQFVDLHNSTLLPNGSYMYENSTLIPPEFITEYNYTILANNGSDKTIQTRKHGCICAVKQCLRFCSEQIQQVYDLYKDRDFDSEYTVKVSTDGDLIKTKHFIYDFHPIYGPVCDIGKFYMLEPELKDNHNWILYENTTLLRVFDKRYLSLDEYCFDINMITINDTEQMLINPIVCTTTPVVPWYEAWAKAFSIPFLIATIIFYNSLTSKNEKNKGFQAYLFFVTLSYTLFSSYTISRIVLDTIPCIIFGFTFYYTNMSYITWTCILSYDIWRALTDMCPNRPKFRTYAILATIIPLLMTSITLWAHKSKLPDEQKPGISETLCALDILRWSAIIYDYLPRMVAFIFSLTLYIKIVSHFKEHDKDMKEMSLDEEERHKDKHKERFYLFFRIFFYTGISWSLDILLYFLRMAFGKKEYTIYMAIELVNALHGFFVFLTFICRPSNLNQVKTRFNRMFNRAETTV